MSFKNPTQDFKPFIVIN